MPHTLIIGTTESGKTRLAQVLEREYAQRGTASLVLDPLRDPRWTGHRFTDADEFNEVVRKSTRCAVFVDESGEVMGRYDDTLTWLATRARHYGHNSHFITQRPAQLNKTVRDMCSHVIMFRISRGDAKLLAEEFVNDDLLGASQLAKLHFIWVARFGATRRGRVDFDANGQPVVVFLTGDAKYASDDPGGRNTTSGPRPTPKDSSTNGPGQAASEPAAPGGANE